MMRPIVIWLLPTMFIVGLCAFGCSDDDDSSSDVDSDSDTDTDADSDADSDTDSDTDSDVDSDTDTDTDGDCSEEDLWWIWDLSVMPPGDVQICATIRGTGENVYVLVEDDAWGVSVVQSMVDNLLIAWDESTPSDSERGIFEQATALFGAPPDEFDEDERIYLFLYEMEAFEGQAFDGYFRIDDQSNGPTSNKHEMLHINSLNSAPDSDYMLSVQAHEFQHLIHWEYDPMEVGWLGEALSEVAMVLTGFGADESWVSSWLNNPSSNLFGTEMSVNYGIALLFGTYMWERFGDAFITSVVADPTHGVSSLDNLLYENAAPVDFAGLIGDLSLAIALDDPDFENGIFGYDFIDFNEVSSAELTIPETTDVTVLGGAGFAFISSDADIDDLTLRLTTKSPDDLQVRVAFTGPKGSELIAAELSGTVTDIPLGPWPGGATLWITAANPSTDNISLSASFL